jgi:hypothetical protein
MRIATKQPRYQWLKAINHKPLTIGQKLAIWRRYHNASLTQANAAHSARL